METPPEDSLNAGPSPGTLRALRDRAHAALAEQRKRMQQLESQLTEQLHMVAEELATDAGEDAQSSAEAATEAAAAAHDSLQRDRADWEAEQAIADAQITQRMTELAAQTGELAAREEQLGKQQAEVDAKQQKLDVKQQDLDVRQEELDAQQKEVENKRQQLGEDSATIEEHRQELEKTAEESQRERDDLDRGNEELQQGREALAADREELKRQQAEIEKQQDERAAQLQAQLDAESGKRQEQQEQAETTQAELEQVTSERDNLRAELQAAEENRTQSEADWEKERTALAADLDRLVTALEESGQKLDAAKQLEERAAGFDELEQKFNLALEDVRTLRERNAELEQELARRPEQGESESAELVELRDERDALAARVEELENRPPVEVENNSADEMADMQRRFEMAVDDVRELRKENEALVEELASARRAAVSGDDAGGLDWETQKQRLLASLEGEEGALTPERTEERAKIESTLRITDDVVAEKDREIAQLTRQLESANEQPSDSIAAEEIHREAIDADEVIQSQREKLSALEEQMTEQLRKAELELSVERAKIAREKTELTDARHELETLRNSLPKGNANTPGGKGKWFSKLGLGGEE